MTFLDPSALNPRCLFFRVDASGILRALDERWREWAGEDPAELLGRPWLEVFSLERHEELKKAFREAVQSRAPRQLEGVLHLRTGGPKEVRLLLLPGGADEHGLVVAGAFLEVGPLRLDALVHSSQNALLDDLARGAPLRHLLQRVCLRFEAAFPRYRCAVVVPEGTPGLLPAVTAPHLPGELRALLPAVLFRGPAALDSSTRRVERAGSRSGRWLKSFPGGGVWRKAAAAIERARAGGLWVRDVDDPSGSFLAFFCVFAPAEAPFEEPMRIMIEGSIVFVRLAIHIRRTEEELRRSESRYRNIFEHAPVPLWRENFAEGKKRLDRLRRSGVRDFREFFDRHPEEVAAFARLLLVEDVNPAAVRFHHASSREQLIGDVAKTFTEKSLEVFKEELIALAAGRTEFSAPAEVRTLTGEPREVLIQLTVPKGHERKLDRLIVSIVDLTPVRAAERREAELHRRLAEKQRLESLGLLAGGVAHDFNNLLTAVLGNTELLLEDLPEDSPLRPRLETILLTVERAGDLCRQLLAYSGKGKVLVEPFDLGTLVEETLGIMGSALLKRASLDVKIEPDLPPVRGDRAQIQQVVLNLLTNAAEALRSGRGRLAVRLGAVQVGREEVPALVPGEWLSPGRYLRLSIEDDGVGMDAETLRSIFDPFFTTKFTGRGLGLAAVQGILRSHEGSVQIDSEPGRGTRAEVFLPVERESTGRSRT